MICDSCKKDFPEEAIHTKRYGKRRGNYCMGCFNKNFITCALCHKDKLRSLSTTVTTENGEEHICKACTDFNLGRTFFTCSSCGKVHKLTLLKEIDGKLFCTKCLDKNIVYCGTCHKPIAKRTAIFVEEVSGYFCSKEHLPKTHVECVRCNNVIVKEKAREVYLSDNRMEYICSNCLRYSYICSECKRRIYGRDAIIAADGKKLCETCYRKNIVRCPDCGRDYYSYDLVSYETEKGTVRICKECRFNKIVRSWDFKPEPRYLKTSEDNDNCSYFGIELEVTTKNDDAGEIAQSFVKEFKDKIPRLFYLKADGSIKPGFEIVTHPMTYNYIRYEFMLRPILRWLQQYVYEDGNGRCAIHIHIDKIQIKEREKPLCKFEECNPEVLSNETKYLPKGWYAERVDEETLHRLRKICRKCGKSLGDHSYGGSGEEEDDESLLERNKSFLQKLYIFFYVNFDKIIKFSDRKNMEWVKKYCFKLNREQLSYMLNGQSNGDHHACINACARNTIEIRTFNGTVDFDVFMKYVRFVYHLIEFLKSISKSIFVEEYRMENESSYRNRIEKISGKRNNSWELFTEYVRKENPILYSALISYEKEK